MNFLVRLFKAPLREFGGPLLLPPQWGESNLNNYYVMIAEGAFISHKCKIVITVKSSTKIFKQHVFTRLLFISASLFNFVVTNLGYILLPNSPQGVCYLQHTCVLLEVLLFWNADQR